MSRLKTVGWYALKIKFHVIYVTNEVVTSEQPRELRGRRTAGKLSADTVCHVLTHNKQIVLVLS